MDYYYSAQEFNTTTSYLYTRQSTNNQTKISYIIKKKEFIEMLKDSKIK